jgi:C-terminal peptidase prc
MDRKNEVVKGKHQTVGDRARVLAPQVALAAILSLLVVHPFLVAEVPVEAAKSDPVVVSTSTREGRLAVFDDAWSTINERYYDREFHGLDWGLQRTTFREHAAEANSSEELYVVLRRMIAPLNDAHTRVFAPEEKSDWWRPRFVTIGLGIKEVDGLPTVVQVERGSAPHRAGIRLGDVIEAVNGEPALIAVNRRINIFGASPTGPARLRAFAALTEGPPGSSVEIGWKGKDGQKKSARFERYWQQRELSLRFRGERGNFVIIEIEAFTRSIAAAFAREFKGRIAGARGVILDLRNNGGGDAEAMSDVASAFLGTGLSLGQFTDRFGVSLAIYTRAKSPYMAERIEPTMLPVVVLSSERTSSAAEIFIAAMKKSKRGTIIGSETCGCVLAIRHRHSLPDGGLLDVSEMDYQTSAGERLEKHGIKPDELVLIQRSDLYSNRDRAIDRAVLQLTQLQSRLN